MRKNIDLYLRSAFRELDAFAIPNVGTFSKIYRAAEVEEHITEVRPPMIDLEFQPHVREDVILTRYFTENIHMEFSEAEMIVFNISEVIVDALDRKGKYHIDQIGTLIRNWKGDLIFQRVSDDKDIFAHEFFGLQPVSFQKKLPSEMESLDKEVEMLDSKHSKSYSTQEKLNWKSSVLILSFLTLTVLTLLNRPENDIDSMMVKNDAASQTDNVSVDQSLEEITANTDQLQVGNEEEPVITEYQDQIENESSSDQMINSDKFIAQNTQPIENTRSPEVNSDKTVATSRGLEARQQGVPRGVNQENTAEINPAEEFTSRGLDQLSPESSTVYYYVIAGSYSSLSAAESFVKKKKANGESAKIIKPKNEEENYRVSIFWSANKDEVIRYLNQEKQKGDKTIWVYSEEVESF